MEEPNKENTLYLPIKQIYFDQIIQGTKNKEYREIKDTTFRKYLLCDEKGFPYISADIPEDAPWDLYMYNDGVYPFFPKEYKYLELAVGYSKNRDKAIVEITDITFELIRDEHNQIIRYDWDADTESFVPNPDGFLTYWNIVYHLGKVVSYTPKTK